MSPIIATLLGIFFGITFLNAMIMFYVWRRHYRELATSYWAAANILAATSAAMYGLRPYLPLSLSIFCGFFAGVSGVLFIGFGIAQFVGRPLPWRMTIVALAILSVGLPYFLFVQDNAEWRFLIYSILIVLITLNTVVYLLRPITPPDGDARIFVAIAMLIFSLGWIVEFLITVEAFQNLLPISEQESEIFWLCANITSSILLPMSLLLLISERLLGELGRQASIDSLTGILNRRGFFSLAQVEIARGIRHNRPVAMIILDIDHFKLVNDRYGHAAGDKVLVQLAATIGQTLRLGDLFCRMGGEEFCLLLTEVGELEAINIAKRIKDLVSSNVLRLGTDEISITASLGLTMVVETNDSLSDALAAADKALYRAKDFGRNRIEIEPSTNHVVRQ